jgi:hypothetical protein
MTDSPTIVKIKIKIKRSISATDAPLSLGRGVAEASRAENASVLLNVEDFSRGRDGLGRRCFFRCDAIN